MVTTVKPWFSRIKPHFLTDPNHLINRVIKQTMIWRMLLFPVFIFQFNARSDGHFCEQTKFRFCPDMLTKREQFLLGTFQQIASFLRLVSLEVCRPDPNPPKIGSGRTERPKYDLGFGTGLALVRVGFGSGSSQTFRIGSGLGIVTNIQKPEYFRVLE